VENFSGVDNSPTYPQVIHKLSTLSDNLTPSTPTASPTYPHFHTAYYYYYCLLKTLEEKERVDNSTTTAKKNLDTITHRC
jgi:hypothetical protein